jgi:hypothetical protein
MIVLLWCYESSLNITTLCRRYVSTRFLEAQTTPQKRILSCVFCTALSLELQVNANGFFKT